MLLKKITYGRFYAAIEHTTNNSKNYYNFLQLKQHKNELIVNNKLRTYTFEDVLDSLKNQKHIFLIVNTQQVLTKEISVFDGSILSAVKTAFPNIAIHDFYYEVVKSETKTFIAISRKKYIDNLLNSYQNKSSIIGFSLGDLAVKNLLPFIDCNEELCTSNAKIIIENKSIKNILKENTTSTTYLINDLQVTNNDVLSLSGILYYYIKDKNTLNGLEKKTKELVTDYENIRFFNLGLYAMLSVLFTVLLINFLLFSNYHSKIDQLNSKVQRSDNQRSQLARLQNQVQQKEKIVNSLQAITNSKVSFYLDEIAQEIPNTILLSELTYQPLKFRIKQDKPIQIRQNHITLAGLSKKENDFTSFVSNLESKKWIERATIINFGKDKTSLNSFEILINLLNEQ